MDHGKRQTGEWLDGKFIGDKIPKIQRQLLSFFLAGSSKSCQDARKRIHGLLSSIQ